MHVYIFYHSVTNAAGTRMVRQVFDVVQTMRLAGIQGRIDEPVAANARPHKVSPTSNAFCSYETEMIAQVLQKESAGAWKN